MQIILGIDPGTRCTGYGIIWIKNSQQECISYGQITPKTNVLSERLFQIYDSILEIIRHHQPTHVAIEQIFVHHNANSALKLGQARGAALVAAASGSLTVAEYSPRQIKQATVGYGNATKEQMQHMTKVLLKLEKTPPSDAADALAVALCHSHHQTVLHKINNAITTAGAIT